MLCLVALDGWYYFFFQAEDGIRDIGVTGVQTCALPISVHDVVGDAITLLLAEQDLATEGLGVGKPLHHLLEHLGSADDVARSEERRVGKECRSRWSPYH